jgi:phosphatidate phosphatase APP1
MRVGKGVVGGGEEAVRATARTVEAAARSSEAARIVSGVDDRVASVRRSRKFGRDTFRGLHITVHRGYVVGAQARVHIRVTEAPIMDEDAAGIPYVDILWLNLRKYAALSLPGLRLTVTIGEESVDAVTGRHGIVAVTVPVDPDLAPGWHDVVVSAQPEGENVEAVSATGQVLKPHPEADLAVVSDIDDTIIRTGLTDRLTALRRALFRDAHSRQAVPGMASLYRGLARGIRRRDGSAPPERAFHYVSTGSWAFYEMLVQFQQLRAFPRGPMFLTDWGPTEKYITRSGIEHKRGALCRLFEGYSDTRFVLIGDSGESDPIVYGEMAERFTDRVECILIVLADPDNAERAEELAGIAETSPVPLLVVADAREAAHLLHERGIIDRDTIDEVTVEVAARI